MPISIMSAEVQAAFDQARSLRTQRVAAGSQTVEIPTPFPSPEDWRDLWIYSYGDAGQFGGPRGVLRDCGEFFRTGWSLS
jgi:hypothetical protein